MRGSDEQSSDLFSYLSPESRVRPDHPLRAVRAMTDAALAEISSGLEALYATGGRPSIPPEQLLRALVLQVLYSVRSERLLMEEIDYSILFRWFVGLGLDAPIWSHSTFSKNRDRLLRGDIAGVFFVAVQEQARAAGLLSDEHFTVDGTQLEAWASLKSFQPRDTPPPDDPDPGNPTINFKGQRRKNDTHVSRTDPDARLYRKADGEKAVLAYLGHVLLDNRHGLVQHACVTPADGFAERDAALLLLDACATSGGTVGADKGYHVADFVQGVRALGLTPHVAMKAKYNAIDGRVTRTPGYAISQQKRKLVEQVFGWMKTSGCCASCATAAANGSTGSLPSPRRSTTWSACARSSRRRNPRGAERSRGALGPAGENSVRPACRRRCLNRLVFQQPVSRTLREIRTLLREFRGTLWRQFDGTLRRQSLQTAI